MVVEGIEGKSKLINMKLDKCWMAVRLFTDCQNLRLFQLIIVTYSYRLHLELR